MVMGDSRRRRSPLSKRRGPRPPIGRSRSVLDSLAAPLAVLDPTGEILLVNRAWPQFAACLGDPPEKTAGVGGNYFELARRAFPEEVAREVTTGMLDVLAGRAQTFTAEYPPVPADTGRCFLVTATALLPGRRGVVVTHTDITERKAAEIERQKAMARARGFSEYLAEADEDLRAGIARELHDRIGQNLAATALDLDILRSQLPAGPLSAVERRLDDAARLVEQMVRDVRDLMGELRPPLLDDVGLIAALRWYGQQFNLRSGVAFRLQGWESVPRLAAGTESAVFRIVQEALTNVAMHARAGTVSARFSTAKDAVVLVIVDDGAGFDVDGPAGSGVRPAWGLRGMRERAEAVGGTVRVESSVGAGTRVTIEVPR